MNIEILAKNIVSELITSGALAAAVNNAVNSPPVTPNATVHPITSTTGNFTPDQKLRFGLRGDVMNLTEKLCAKYGYEKIAVFGALKKLTGTSQSEATPAELSKRVDILQGWLEHGMK